MGAATLVWIRRYEMSKAWIPRKCFVCGEKGGWGKNNVDAIWVYEGRPNHFWAHFHPHCLKDIICCPGNYKNEDVHFAVKVYKKWEELLLKERIDRKGKELDLKKMQEEICERS